MALKLYTYTIVNKVIFLNLSYIYIFIRRLFNLKHKKEGYRRWKLVYLAWEEHEDLVQGCVGTG